MERVASRVGILDQVSQRIRSVRRPEGVQLEEIFGLDADEVRSWFNFQAADEDDSYIAFFYRCLEEGSEFYYLYQAGDKAGWRCGSTTWDTPILGRLVPYEEARAAVEDWCEDLKWSQTMGE